MTSPATESRLQQKRPAGERSAVLLISPFEEDHIFVAEVCVGVTWNVSGVFSCAEALEVLPVRLPAVVICDWELPDGDWKKILGALELMWCPPPLVVTSRLADERLWGEVLNLGGFDVLAKPFDRREVLWVINSAWQKCHYRREPIARGEETGAATMQ